MRENVPLNVSVVSEGIWNQYQGWLLLVLLAAGLAVLLLGKRQDVQKAI